MSRYVKMCVEKNSDFTVYYGKGEYTSSCEQVLHYDTNYTVSYFVHCSGSIKISGNHYMLTSGDVVILNPREVHKCEIDENSFHERISVCINKSFFDGFCKSCDDLSVFFENRKEGAGNVIPSEIANKFSLNQLFNQMLVLSQNKNFKNKVLLSCKVAELLYNLDDALSDNHLPPVFSIDENPVIADAIKYINVHFTEEIDCTLIAEMVSVSKSHLDHLFKEFVGMPMWEYVLVKRLLLVNQYIGKGVSVNEASYKAGFRNYSNFYRLYKKHFDITPAEYKCTLKAKGV